MGRCATEYCSAEHTGTNKGYRVPCRDPGRFRRWYVRMGRISKVNDMTDSELAVEIKKAPRVCASHIHEGGLYKTKGGVIRVAKDAEVMTHAEYTRKLAEKRQQEKIEKDNELLEQLETLNLLTSNNKSTPRVSTRTQVAAIVRDPTNVETRPAKKVHTPTKIELAKFLEVEEAAVAKAVLELYDAKKKMSHLQETICELTKKCAKLEEACKTANHTNEQQEAQSQKLHNTIKKIATNVQEIRVYKLSYEYIITDAKKVQLWTGFQSIDKFTRFMQNLKYHCEKYKPGRLTASFEDAVLMWFVRVRHNVYESVIAHLFGIATVQTVSNILNDANLILLAYFRHPANNPMQLFNKDVVSMMILQCFKDDYPNLATVVDATEFFIETPSNLDFQRATWSSYKHHNTVKMLVCMNAAGHCVFCSPLYQPQGHLLAMCRCLFLKALARILRYGGQRLLYRGFIAGRMRL